MCRAPQHCDLQGPRSIGRAMWPSLPPSKEPSLLRVQPHWLGWGEDVERQQVSTSHGSQWQFKVLTSISQGWAKLLCAEASTGP